MMLRRPSDNEEPSPTENIEVLVAFVRQLVHFTTWRFGRIEGNKAVEDFACAGGTDDRDEKLRFLECYRRQSRRMDPREIAVVHDTAYPQALTLTLMMSDGKEGMLVLLRDEDSEPFTGYDQLLLAFIRDVSEECLVTNSIMQEAREQSASQHFLSGTIERLRRRNTLLRAARRFLITPRECEVVAYLLDGMRIDEISERLFISTSTVNDHVKKLLERTGAANRSEMLARILGWNSRLAEDPADAEVRATRR